MGMNLYKMGFATFLLCFLKSDVYGSVRESIKIILH